MPDGEGEKIPPFPHSARRIDNSPPWVYGSRGNHTRRPTDMHMIGIHISGSLTLEPAGYHGRAHLQRRLYLVPSMYNICMILLRSSITVHMPITSASFFRVRTSPHLGLCFLVWPSRCFPQPGKFPSSKANF